MVCPSLMVQLNLEHSGGCQYMIAEVSQHLHPSSERYVFSPLCMFETLSQHVWIGLG